MNTLSLGLKRIRYELVGYFRARDAVVFTFLFPIGMLLLFGSIFRDQLVGPPGEEISMAAIYFAGMLAAGVWLSGLQTLAIDLATEKHEGGLKRLAATPLTPTAYFIGKLGLVFITNLIQMILLVLVGVFVFEIALPTEPEEWLTFAWVWMLGLACFTALGIALSALPRSARAASAVIIPIVLIPQFLTGVYLPLMLLPDWLQQVAQFVPLTWVGRGMRAVFLPDFMEAMELNSAWDLGMGAINIAIWLVIGLVLSKLTFRWMRERSK
ncbi:ABC transporter permease [Pseudoclavibacter alba]|uniref:ABC transporter permease n=1 Tax=Pseudoclavibacter albus TaxID=272241 RepID=A0ABT2HXP6_9MICO|nr:ABC transporter permease [Pseudoclavibacter alba]MCT2043091.1 ABC transporter permease [Pseudoclavibacter alba]